ASARSTVPARSQSPDLQNTPLMTMRMGSATPPQPLLFGRPSAATRVASPQAVPGMHQQLPPQLTASGQMLTPRAHARPQMM
ncbi:unnamed protein product, partial [Polarella glacialis]